MKEIYDTEFNLSINIFIEKQCIILICRSNVLIFNFTFTRTAFWQNIMRRVWSEFMPFPLEKNAAQPCSFPEIFSDHFPAAYFTNLWAEVSLSIMYCFPQMKPFIKIITFKGMCKFYVYFHL